MADQNAFGFQSLVVSEDYIRNQNKYVSSAGIQSVVPTAAEDQDQGEADNRVASWAVSFDRLLRDPEGQQVFTVSIRARAKKIQASVFFVLNDLNPKFSFSMHIDVSQATCSKETQQKFRRTAKMFDNIIFNSPCCNFYNARDIKLKLCFLLPYIS